MFSKLIFDYARGKKLTQEVERKEFKQGYHFITLKEVKGKPFASFVAGLNSETNKFHIGIMACDTKRDVFSKEFGRSEAEDRLRSWDELDNQIFFGSLPRKLVPFYIAFYDRCKKYYQGSAPAYDYLTLLGIEHNEFIEIDKGESSNATSN